MRGRVLPEQKLRGSDSTLLEVQLADVLGLPMEQLALVNVCDIFALSEHESPPSRLKSGLDGFCKRVAREVADLPNGPSWATFIQQLGRLEPSRVPQSLRDLLAEELLRETREPGTANDLLQTWEQVQPDPFQLGSQATRVTRATAAPQRAETSRRGIGIATDKPAKKSGGSSRRAAAKPVIDIDRRAWVTDQVLERLSGGLENGLAETVLLAGIRNRARETYPDLMPYEILKILKDMKEAGTLRYSAGRWKRPERW